MQPVSMGSKMSKTVLLTGANGFVGSHIADALLARGDHVRAMVRKTSDLQWLERKPVELVYGNLQDRKSLAAAVDGVDAVIHNAGIVSAPNKYLYYLHNSEGTRTLLETIDRFAVKISRFVYVSSQAAGGPTHGNSLRLEEDPPNPITHYGKSKLVAEGHLQRFRDRFPVSIVRPPAIYGPRDKAFLTYFKLVSAGWTILFGEERLLTLTHVQDLAQQILLQLDDEKAINQVFHAAPFDPVTLEQFCQAISTVLGADTRRVVLPDCLLKPVFAAALPVFQVLGARPPMQPDKIPDFMQSKWTISGVKARELLGYEGRMPLITGVGQTSEWYRWKGWLKSPRDRLKIPAEPASANNRQMVRGRTTIRHVTCVVSLSMGS